VGKDEVASAWLSRGGDSVLGASGGEVFGGGLSLAGANSNSGNSSTNRVSAAGSACLRCRLSFAESGATSDDVVDVAVSAYSAVSADEAAGVFTPIADAPAAAEKVKTDFLMLTSRNLAIAHLTDFARVWWARAKCWWRCKRR
jgi:hypothetical protein